MYVCVGVHMHTHTVCSKHYTEVVCVLYRVCIDC
jgi:hypothetical protein